MFYFRLDADLTEKLDRRIRRIGYTSRTEFFTAAAYAALYGFQADGGGAEGAATLPESVKDWLTEQIPDITDEQIQQDLQDLIAAHLTAVIAMKGVDVAFENTWEDIHCNR